MQNDELTKLGLYSTPSMLLETAKIEVGIIKPNDDLNDD